MTRDTKLGRPARLLAAAAIILGTILLSTGVANALPASPGGSGVHKGGCLTYDAREVSGYNIGICTSQNNGLALPDIYVNHSATTANCHIDIETWDNHNHNYGATPTDCGTGHKVAFPVGPFTDGKTVHTFARLWIGNKWYWTGDSPAVDLIPINSQLKYNFGYVLTYPPAPRAEDIAWMATHKFQKYFPFPSCGQVIHVGQKCNLTGNDIFVGSNPIEVVSITPTSFSFVSMPGHFEGAGRIITFSFVTNPTTHRLFLDVSDYGAESWQSVVGRDSGSIRNVWQEYANKLIDGIRTKDYQH